jgi:Flp pilus assembly protein TadG
MRVLRRSNRDIKTTAAPGGRRWRVGVATVELAVCLPVAVTLVMGMIDASNAMFTKQSLKIAAYESARIASSTNSTAEQAIARAQEVLKSRGLEKARVVITPRVTKITPRGTPVTVSIKMDTEDASYSAAWLGKDADFSTSVRMVRL